MFEVAKNNYLVYNQERERIIDKHLLNGVEIMDAFSTHIDDTVTIETGAVILPFCCIKGSTVIKSGAVVESSKLIDCTVESGAYIESSRLEGCSVESGASVVMSHLVDSRVGSHASIGPFARLRGANIGENCRIGDFVEVKGSMLHEGVKAAHLAYIGDAEVGAKTNIGCGTVFCNYDGKEKNKTVVGEECFIGANVNLVAPLAVKDRAFIAAGTTVTKDLEKDTFTIGRVRQESKERKK